MPTSVAQFLTQLRATSILPEAELRALEESVASASDSDAELLAQRLVREKKLTLFQATQLYRGRGDVLVLGNYLVLEKLGQGGMGVVYKARHRVMNRLVAIKVLPAALQRDNQAKRRFLREVRAAAQLAHPNIVAAYDAYGADETNDTDKLLFLAMEFVDGVDLSTLLRQRGQLSISEAIDHVLQAAKGLEYAHGMGIIHRDIKPGNMLLSRDGVVKVLDLGLARFGLVADGDGDDDLTRSNQMLGTVDYMAPEQSYDTHQADERSDIYSLGCTLFRLLTGEPPYVADTAVQRIMAHREAPIPSLRERRPDASPRLDALCRRMMAKRPEDRPQSMREVIDELRGIEAGQATSTGGPAVGDSLPLLDHVTQATFGAAAGGGPPSGPPNAASQNTAQTAGAWFAKSGRSTSWLPGRRMWMAGTGLAILALACGWWWAGGPSPRTDDSGFASMRQSGPASAVPSKKAAANSRRVLIVVPAQNYWIPDLDPVRTRLTEADIVVEIASSRTAIRGAGERSAFVDATAQLTVSDALNQLDQYDAVYFVGTPDRNEFAVGANAAEARQLIQRMLNQRKIVASLCRGTDVLFAAGALRGRRVAIGNSTQILRERDTELVVEWQDNQRVVRDERSGVRILTGGDPEDAFAFANALLAMLRGQ